MVEETARGGGYATDQYILASRVLLYSALVGESSTWYIVQATGCSTPQTGKKKTEQKRKKRTLKKSTL